MKKEKNHKLYRKMGFYERYIKRAIDIFCSGLAIIVFCWLYAIIALLVRIKLGSPVLFTQYRPGLIDPKTGKERIFKMYKFRTMTDKKDAEGNLLPDEVRLTKFGAWLRSTSLDELPEAFCILNGDSGIIGTTKKNLDFKGFRCLVEFCYDNFSVWLCRVSCETAKSEWFLGCLF